MTDDPTDADDLGPAEAIIHGLLASVLIWTVIFRVCGVL